MSIDLRPARASDIPALQAVIERSARALSVGFYSPAQIEAAIRYVFGVDSVLIVDGTYFAALDGEIIVGCGGWSRRRGSHGVLTFRAAHCPAST
jgi:hypothetical protein